MLKRNVVANVLGGTWAALLALLLIPFQVRILGVEAYGLLAFLASAQVVFSIFDLGLSPAITREIAKDDSPGRERSRDLVRAVSALYWPVGIVIGLGMFAGSGWLAGHWLHLVSLPAGRATAAIGYGALAIVLRWPVSFYSGVLAGRQRFDQLNLLKAGVATVSAAGGLIVMLVSRDLVSYTEWTALAAAIEVTGYVILVARATPGLVGRPSARLIVDRGLWSFAIGIGLINLLSMALTQSDRILIGKILPIDALGYYAVAYNIVYGLSLVQTLVTSAVFPAFVRSSTSQALDELRQRYQVATQALMYVFNLAVWLLVFFGHDILAVITSRAAADHSAAILALLAIGFLFNAATALSYTASIASGNTWLPIRVNIVGVVGYLPLLTLLTIRWGGVGAAAAWVVLNLYYLPSLLRLAHRDVLRVPNVAWLARNFVPFVIAAVLVFAAARGIATLLGAGNVASIAVAFAGCVGYAAAGFSILGGDMRHQIAASFTAIRIGRVAVGPWRT